MENQESNPVPNLSESSIPQTIVGDNKLRKTTKIYLIIITILFILEIIPVFLGLIFTFNVAIIGVGFIISCLILFSLIGAWKKYKDGYYSNSKHLLIIPFAFELLVVVGLALVLSPVFLLRPIVSKSIEDRKEISQTNEIKNVVTPTTANQPITNTTKTNKFGIMTVTYGGNVSVSNASFAWVSQASSTQYTLQSDNYLIKGVKYLKYFSGIDGFTEYYPSATSTPFVDTRTIETLYDQNNNIILKNDNITTSGAGVISAKGFASGLNLKFTIPNDFKSGNYRWVSEVIDNKNTDNYLKGEVDFIIK